MKIVSYNILGGGFGSYDEEGSRPERLEALVRAIKSVKADVVALIDTYRWKKNF